MDWIVVMWVLAVVAVFGGYVVVAMDAKRTKRQCDEIFRKFAQSGKAPEEGDEEAD